VGEGENKVALERGRHLQGKEGGGEEEGGRESVHMAAENVQVEGTGLGSGTRGGGGMNRREKGGSLYAQNKS